MKKTKVKEQIDGKLEQKTMPTTLDQIWGDKGNSAYGTMDVEEYKAKLDDLNVIDIQEECIRRGFLPSTERSRMIKRLLQEFNSHVGDYKPRPVINNAKKVDPKILKILAEGK
jgi:hypothetical protein